MAEIGVVGSRGAGAGPMGAAAVLAAGGGMRGGVSWCSRISGVIERYNTADAYVIAVGHTGRPDPGGAGISVAWHAIWAGLGARDRMNCGSG